jgi:8-oxo-dGTP pyrophosphatase MutT (NUDIX family)
MASLDLEDLRKALAAHELAPSSEVIPGIVRREAGVLVPVRVGPSPSVLLTARGEGMREHAGELCFPGGKPEQTDADLARTALREAHEEIGLAPSNVQLVGPLSPVPTATSAYRLNPFVGAITEGASSWTLSPEVSRVVDLPLDAAARGDVRFCVTLFPWRGAEHPTPFFETGDGSVVYGATAYVLWELFAVLAPLGYALPEPAIVAAPPWMDALVERFRALEAKARAHSPR